MRNVVLHRVSRGVVGCMLGAAAVVIAIAGPLNPPSGAVSSTYKTLTEVEPRIAIDATNTPGDADSAFKITQPGSYYLTGKVTGASGKHGIEITANNVTIDLNGFTMTGATGSLDGIAATAGVLNTAILNGTISGWGDEGIDLYTSTCRSTRVQGVLVSSNLGDGITVCYQSVVRDCIAYLNGGSGIFALADTVVEDCVAKSNTVDGIVVSALGVVSRCESRDNGGNGIRSSGNGYASVVDCVAADNTAAGIKVGSGTLVARNNCAFNESGILVTGINNRIESNTCMSNTRGVDVDYNGNIIIKNTCSDNTTNWDVVAGNVILVVNAATDRKSVV